MDKRTARRRLAKELTPPRKPQDEKSLANLITEKPKWNNLPTKAIRVPEKFAKILLKEAKNLDMGESSQSTSTSIKEAYNILSASLDMKANNGSAIKREIRKALELIKSDIELD
jgi:hypothetical protein